MSIKSRLFSQSTIIFAVRVFGAAIIVLAQAGIARLWGGAVLGQYLLVIAVVNLVAMFMPLGFHTIGSYFAAEYRAKGRRSLLWRFLLRAYSHVALATIGVLALALVLVFFHGNGLPDIARYWMQAAILAAATAIIFVNGALLVGLKRPFAGFFADGLFRPMLVIAAFVLAAAGGAGEARLGVMLWIFALCYCLVALGHFFFVLAAMKTVPDIYEDLVADDLMPGKSEVARWWRFAMPWVLIAVASGFFFDIDLLLLSGLMERETLAVFGVSARIFSLMAFGISAVYALVLPDIFEQAANGKMAEFHRQLGEANLVATGLSLIMFVGILIGGPLILMLFGPAFAVGAIPLAVLSLVLVVRSVLGPGDLVLSINEKPWASLPAIVLGLGALIVANVVLVPALSLLGAALAALIAFAVWSGVLWLTARQIAQIDVSIFPAIARWRRERKLINAR
ncbi:hypothetical protein MNBD_ALPHA12-1922 [hydrothermal vent metagenome]|uniref:Uncharacterized protein n=1 Tax=hydrothermal vent metagenome TaxID=652676 RepID=A0A3B0UKJ0_9ZZZZ